MKRFLLSFTACFMLLVMCAGLATPAFADGSAPVAENLELNTYRNTSVSGMLSAYDPENDVVSFEITTEPIKGDIQLEQNGAFVYTPREGKKGRDYFGYKAVDSQGNVSQEATVIIRIAKQKNKVKYSDMENRAGEYAAVTLSEKGIFTGEQIGASYHFGPDKEVSRGEFYSMCMLMADKAGGEEKISGDPGEAITKSEAAQLLNDTLELNDVEYIQLDHSGEEAVQACMNLSAVGIINDMPQAEEKLSREAAALMLVQALRIIENR